MFDPAANLGKAFLFPNTRFLQYPKVRFVQTCLALKLKHIHIKDIMNGFFV